MSNNQYQTISIKPSVSNSIKQYLFVCLILFVCVSGWQVLESYDILFFMFRHVYNRRLAVF